MKGAPCVAVLSGLLKLALHYFYGSHFFVDTAAGLSVVCMTNTAVTGMAGAFPAALRDAVYRETCAERQLKPSAR